MKSRDENRGLLDGAVKRLVAYPLEKRKEICLKGLAMAMARLKDRQESINKSHASAVSKVVVSNKVSNGFI